MKTQGFSIKNIKGKAVFVIFVLMTIAVIEGFNAKRWWDKSIIISWPMANRNRLVLDAPIMLLDDLDGLFGPAIYIKGDVNPEDGIWYRSASPFAYDLGDNASRKARNHIMRRIARGKTIHTAISAVSGLVAIVILGLLVKRNTRDGP